MKSATPTRFYLFASLLFLLAIVMIGLLISTIRAPISISDLTKAFNSLQNGANSTIKVNADRPLPIYGGQNKIGAAPFSLGDRDPHYTPEPTLTARMSGGGR